MKGLTQGEDGILKRSSEGTQEQLQEGAQLFLLASLSFICSPLTSFLFYPHFLLSSPLASSPPPSVRRRLLAEYLVSGQEGCSFFTLSLYICILNLDLLFSQFPSCLTGPHRLSSQCWRVRSEEMQGGRHMRRAQAVEQWKREEKSWGCLTRVAVCT